MDSRLIIIALVAYLLGSIPFGYILVKLFLKQDIRQTGSGNIGATNVARSGKKGLAITTLLLDAAKGALAVWIAGIVLFPPGLKAYSLGADGPIRPETVGGALTALAAILGHCFPVWLRFRGGKGVATAIGAFAMLAPSAALVATCAFAVIFAVSRYVSLSSILAAAIFPILVYRVSEQRSVAVMSLVVLSSLVIILKHHGNIRRLIAGTEPKFGKKTIGSTDPIQTEKSL